MSRTARWGSWGGRIRREFWGYRNRGITMEKLWRKDSEGFSGDTEIGPRDEEVVKTLMDGLGISKLDPAMEGLWRLDLMK